MQKPFQYKPHDKLRSDELGAIQDRFLYYFREMSVRNQDRTEQQSFMTRAWYYAVTEFLQEEANKASDKND